MDTYRGSSSGAFKTVEIYDNYVIKRARVDEDNCERPLSLNEAKYDLRFLDESGNFVEDFYFDYINNFSYGRSCSADPEDCNNEMEREFNILKTFSRNPLVPKLLGGDESEYKVERINMDQGVQKFGRRFDGKIKSTMKQVEKEVNKKMLVRGLKKQNLDTYRIEDVVERLLSHNAPISFIAEDIFQLIVLDKQIGIIGDLHRANFGVKRGRLKIVDLGQTSEPISLREVYDEKIQRSFYRRKNLAYQTLKYYVLRAKEEKKVVKINYKGEGLTIKKVEKNFIYGEYQERFIMSDGCKVSVYNLTTFADEIKKLYGYDYYQEVKKQGGY